MTEQENKAKFKQAINKTLSGLQADPFLAQRVIAQAKKGDEKVKYCIPRGLVIALIAVLCMGTVAVAAGLYGGTVNWLGEVIPDEREYAPMPTMAPPMAEPEFDLNEDELDKLVVDGTMLMVSEIMDDGEIIPHASVLMKRTKNDLDTFYALMEEGKNLPLPKFIPEGYEFVEGEVFYECRAEGQWNLMDRKALRGGLIAEVYAPRVGDEIISGYYMFFRSSMEDYHYLSIYARLTETQDVNEHVFGFLGGQTAQAVSVPGMNNALAITGENNCNLQMLRALDTPVEILRFNEPDWQEVCTLTELDVNVSAPLLDVDTLIRMFATE